MSNLDELFCHVDDWAQKFKLLWQEKFLSNGVMLN
ncbi:IS982 family transposase [Cyanobacterium sp. HL-69]|nr:IS982 family transposase [Cyanobacterium sp. HL-69]